MAVKKARELLKLIKVTSLPINPFIIAKLLNIQTFTVNWVAAQLNRPHNTIINGMDSDLYLINGQYKIIYNESAYPTRIPFTIAHEIGHCYLHHLEDFDQTDIKSSGTSGKEYFVLETEANSFAAELLMPYPVIYQLGLLLKEELIHFCRVSQSAAESKIKTITNSSFIECWDDVEDFRDICEQFEPYRKTILLAKK